MGISFDSLKYVYSKIQAVLVLHKNIEGDVRFKDEEMYLI